MDLKFLLNDYESNHSKFQIENFIINLTGGTNYGKYKQCLRELMKRFKTIKELYQKQEKLKFKRNTQLKKIEIFELNESIKALEKEFEIFYSNALILKNKLKELTKENIEKYEEELWIFNLKKNAALDIMSTGNISRSVLEAIMSCDKQSKEELLLSINNKSKLIEWLENQDFTLDNKENKYVDMKKLLGCDLNGK